MLTIHHLGVSQSERVIWLCEELGLPYNLRRYDRDPVIKLAPPDYKALHPVGTAPVLDDGELRMAESGAVLEYILGKYGNGQLVPAADAENFAEYLFWFHYANATLMPGIMLSMITGMLGLAADNPVMKGLLGRTSKAFALIESRLGEADYFAGSAFTAADIMMVFPLTTMRHFAPRDLSGYPNTLAYLGRIGARPAYRLAMEKGDPGLPPLLG